MKLCWPLPLNSESCPLLPFQFDSPDRFKEHLFGILNVSGRGVASVGSRSLLPPCSYLCLSSCDLQGLGFIFKNSLSPKTEHSTD